MNYVKLDIQVGSAEGIPCNGILSKKKIYAVVYIAGSSCLRQSSENAKYAGNIAIWNCPMRFYVEESKVKLNQLVLMIQLRSRRLVGGDKIIGEVSVPLSRLYQNGMEHVAVDEKGIGMFEAISSSHPKHSNRQSILYFSYKFGERIRAKARDADWCTLFGKKSSSSSIPSAPNVD